MSAAAIVPLELRVRVEWAREQLDEIAHDWAWPDRSSRGLMTTAAVEPTDLPPYRHRGPCPRCAGRGPIRPLRSRLRPGAR